MCMLRESGGTLRMIHNQLLGVRRGVLTVRRTAGEIRLGTIQWIRTDSRNETQCGIRLFPGVPEAVKVRPANFNMAKGQEYELALVTQAVAMPAAPLSMVLPAGWFQAGRLLEIQGAEKRVAKLLSLIERGADFDRCAISIE